MRTSVRFRVLIEDDFGTFTVACCIGIAGPSNNGVRRIGTGVRAVELPAGTRRRADVVFFCSVPNGCDDVVAKWREGSETLCGVLVL